MLWFLDRHRPARAKVERWMESESFTCGPRAEAQLGFATPQALLTPVGDGLHLRSVGRVWLQALQLQFPHGLQVAQ